MPTLDDTPTLETTSQLKPQDLIVVNDDSASGGSKIRKVPVGIIASGFTHALVYNYDSPDVSGAGTGGNFTAFTTPAYAGIGKVRLVVTELFVGMSAPVIEIGDADDPNGFITSTALNARNIKQCNGADLQQQQSFEANTATKAFNIALDDSSAGENFNTLTAGQFVVFVELIDSLDVLEMAKAITAE